MIAEVIAQFAQAITLRRTAAGSESNGRYTPGATTDTPIEGAVVPSTGKDLERLPEGMRTKEVRRILTETALRVAPDPDILVMGGVEYEVQSVADWADQGGFYDCLAVRRVS